MQFKRVCFMSNYHYMALVFVTLKIICKLTSAFSCNENVINGIWIFVPSTSHP